MKTIWDGNDAAFHDMLQFNLSKVSRRPTLEKWWNC